MAHFGNNKPPQKVATPSYTNDYKRVPTLLGHHFCLIPFLVMERGVNMENKLSKGAHYPYFVLPKVPRKTHLWGKVLAQAPLWPLPSPLGSMMEMGQ